MTLLEDGIEKELEDFHLSTKRRADLKKSARKEKEKVNVHERKIATDALKVLRYIFRRGGKIDENTKKTRFSPTEREATNQLLKSGWLREEEIEWKSPYHRFRNFIIGFSSLAVGLFLTSYYLVPVELLIGISSTLIVIAIFIFSFGISTLYLTKTFYSIPSTLIKLSKESVELLMDWREETRNTTPYYGAMEGETEDKIKEKVFSRLQFSSKEE